MTFNQHLYLEEFLRYFDMAKTQQAENNLGLLPHVEGSVRDQLMQDVTLYDVVNRKYAGFTQILLDMWYGDSPEHPYAAKLHEVRKPIARRFGAAHTRSWSIPEWLYVFILHRVTGSGINYAKQPSGYNNTILPLLDPSLRLGLMSAHVGEILRGPAPAYTSVGYQFPAFPKKDGTGFKRGGDRFLVEFAPTLSLDLADFLTRGPKKSLREVGHFMWSWNRDNGLRAYKFQYAAVVADIADFYPELVDPWSHFFYGSNAVECLSYLSGGSKSEKDLDLLMDCLATATGGRPYDLEDVACDFIRWVENYVRPGGDYDHLCRDSVWNSSLISDHPFGRQRPMLDLGLIESFNQIDVHPSDDYVLKKAGVSVESYRSDVKKLR
jgi:hypothetical protein